MFTGTPTSRRFALCPSTIEAGDPVFLGDEPAVALNSYEAVTGGATFLTGGSFALQVAAVSVVSPPTGAAIAPRQRIYGTGTLDVPTNVTYDLLLNVVTSGKVFGFLDQVTGILSGVTNNAAVVRLQGAE